MKSNRIVLIHLSVLAAFLAQPAAGQPVGTTFTYQGKLDASGAPADGLHDMRFQLFTAAAGGAQVGGTICSDAVDVSAGVFTVPLDFGAAFDGNARFLQVFVRADSTPANCASGSYTALSPRQPVTATPYALKVPGIDGNSLNAADGLPVDALFVDNDGKVGVGTGAPATIMHAFGDRPVLRLQDDGEAQSFMNLEDTSAGQMRLNKISNSTISFIDLNPMPINGTGAAHVRLFRETNTTGIKSVIFNSGNNTAAESARIGVGGNPSFFQLDGGGFGIGTATPAFTIHARSDLPVLQLQDSGSNSTQSGYVGFLNSSGAETGWMGYGTPGSPHMSMVNARAGGNIQLLPGVGGAVTVPVLEITGADLAEKFPASEKLEPGRVVAIDRNNAGKLCLARGAYNRCVAGIVSGANNFSVGAVLGNLPGQEDAPPIALSGRVYVWCDASSGAIEPGDLLTTAETPGHAMRVSDFTRAPGAVLGKAMGSLAAGERGLVLVLVSLQ